MKVVLMRCVAGCAAAVLLVALAGCGDDSGSDAEPTPEVVAERLQEDGYVTGEVITDGANVGVARNGKLDAAAYLSVDYTPDGDRLYVGIYFFDTEEDAAVLAKEWERTDDRDSDAELVDSRVYNIAGPASDLGPVIATAEAE